MRSNSYIFSFWYGDYLMKHLAKLASLYALMLVLAACSSSNVGDLPGPSSDTVAPVITSVTGVSNGSTYSGSVNITAAATDNVAVTSFTLTIDGTQAAASTSGSLSFSWDTTGASNASHSLVFTARDGGGRSDTETLTVTVDNGGGGGNATVSGVVYMPNGTDPVSGALVYVQHASGSAIGDPPTEPYYAYDYSEADGSFELTNVPTGEQSFKIVKGAFSKLFTFTVAQGSNTLPGAQTTLPNESGGGATVEKMAVVTGAFDAIENVLARLGLGTVNGTGTLELGTEKFTLIDGNNSLPDGQYQNFDAFFADPSNFDEFRTIFLNCGNDYEMEFFADSDAVNGLKAWINAGGRLYCTDWSYDFCEQLFPQYIDFYGNSEIDGLGNTAETPDIAEDGSSMDTIPATIGDAAMLAWLDALSVTNPDDTVNISDWLTLWSAIEAVSPQVKTWATANITYGNPETSATKPITVTFASGSGMLLFSSYHTEASPQPALTPQDRILQYLIFEVL